MRVWVMENGLVDETGHHFNNSLGLQQECARRGLQTRFLVHREAHPSVLAALAARPLFAFRPYELASRDALSGPMESLFVQGDAFAEGFAAAAGEGLGSGDLVIVPTSLQNELYGCARGLRLLAPERRPRLVLNFVVENFLDPASQGLGMIAPLYRYAARALGQETSNERVLLTANGRGLADGLTQVLARPVAEFPMPKTYPAEAQAVSDASASGDPPSVAILGHSRSEKGFHLVPELVARHPRLRFLVQVSPEAAESMWQGAPIDMRAAPNVVLVRGALEPGAYHALMSDADVVLLPYDTAHMPLRSSGVFSEAVAAGRVAVVPMRSWMGAHLAEGRGAGVVFDAFNADAISAALELAMARLPELRSAARACARPWRAQQTVSAYLQRVLEKFGLSAPIMETESR